MYVNPQTLVALLQKGGIFFLDILFPLRCLGCQTKGSWICAVCLSQIPRRLEQRCPACLRHVTPTGERCFQCRDTTTSALDGIFVASYYQNSLLPRAIHTWKYRFIPDLALPLGQFLTIALQKSSLPLPESILPVPLHKRRLRFRGFNQSALLAQIVSETLTPGLDITLSTDVLLRTRFTKPQMKTDSREERLINLKNAFSLKEDAAHLIKGKTLWLIDDVATTGTTLEECATILKQHGATSVFGIVLAR